MGIVPGHEKLRGVLALRKFTAGEAVIRVPSKLAVRLASATAQVLAHSSSVLLSCWLKVRLRGRFPSLPNETFFLLAHTGQSSSHFLYLGVPRLRWLCSVVEYMSMTSSALAGCGAFESAPHHG